MRACPCLGRAGLHGPQAAIEEDVIQGGDVLAIFQQTEDVQGGQEGGLDCGFAEVGDGILQEVA